MDTFENRSTSDDVYARADEEVSGIKRRLGQLGRRIKRVDVRSQIVDHPFAAVGIAAGVGAIIGLARPMPRRGRVSAAVVALATTIGFRLVREAVMMQLTQLAKDRFVGPRGEREPGMQAQAPQAGL
jgi:hypothetical protein